MVKSMVSIPERWEQFMKRLADDHQIDLNAVISELCEWGFSNAEGKEQFEDWLDDAYPPKDEAEEKASAADEEIAEKEEETEEDSEEESHKHRD